jgi:hypothetical protein
MDASTLGARASDVGDREADIFELFVELDALEDGFVLRATHDRRTTEGSDDARTYSLSEAESAPIVAVETIEVPAKVNRPARKAKLEIRAKRVEVMPPKNADRKGADIWMNVVVVREIDAPSDKEALRWDLLTREPIETTNDVLRVVAIYRQRWKVEEFHMGLKTGCALEERQLESFHALSKFLAFASVVAVRLLPLRDAARAPEPRPASDVLNDVQYKLLRQAFPRLPEACPADRALRAVAELGGFFDTSKKVQPGWRTRGMLVLLDREAGSRAAPAEIAGDRQDGKITRE